MAPSFHASPNVLFVTRVSEVRRLSPGFVRLTLAGEGLVHFAPHGLDQRVKLLVPRDAGFPSALVEDLLHEPRWRERRREVPEEVRPPMRSYTPSAVRPDRAEVDLDVHVHAGAGPASAWAAAARPGAPALLSGPDVRRGAPMHGIQWEPGPGVRRVLLAADETAYPAVRNIAAATAGVPGLRREVLLEAGDPRDAAALRAELPGVGVTVVIRGEQERGGAALAREADAWAARSAADAARLGEGFYAWLATESTWVAGIRDALRAAGVPPHRIHAQGYWHDRERVS
ncbi:siderophore-interacting protein [Streptomyces lonarensis]|uniref:Siderophore-interacting protein n=1 Tax=Streptomyces lonarensis TaxID=700599 RepID=A0A7X6D036_9ACTN|nr:siderophore-interacting protein [Streptomyces lonarensis]NJQ05712.1 siderophore-interacting protein [Streptomyces lonarensis]